MWQWRYMSEYKDLIDKTKQSNAATYAVKRPKEVIFEKHQSKRKEK
jgi:hypothetical protein